MSPDPCGDELEIRWGALEEIYRILGARAMLAPHLFWIPVYIIITIINNIETSL